MMFDAIVVGGSYAGQSAALQLARARRSILVIDGGRGVIVSPRHPMDSSRRMAVRRAPSPRHPAHN